MFTNTYMWLGQKVYVRGIDENGKTTEWLNISQSITDEIKKNRFSPAIFQREVFTHAVGTAMERYDYRKTIHSNDEYVLAMERIVEDYLKTEYGGKTFKHIDIKIVNKSLQSSKKIEVFIPIEVKK